MPDALSTLLLSLVALSGATLVYSLVAIVQIQRSLRSVPTARAGLSLPAPAGGWPSVCIVVPAHNEAAGIGAHAASIRAQDYPRLRVVFALDRCTDDTAGAIRAAVGVDERFELVTIDSCPDGWAGKVHAVWRGVRDSAGARDAELLLFADADTIFDPGCVRAAVALLLSGLAPARDATETPDPGEAPRALHLLSLLSTLTHDRWWEHVAQPVATFELMRHFQLRRVNRAARRRPAFANGQFMLFTRAAYDAVGGHEAVRAELLEDLAFARLIRNAGMRNGVALADRMLFCRMYGSWAEFRRGWKRIFIEAAKRKPARLNAWSSRLLVTGALLPLSSAASLGAGLFLLARAEPDALAPLAAAAGAVALAAWLFAMTLVHRAQRAPLWTTFLHPAGALLSALILREAGADLRAGKGVAWAGKTYVRPTR